MRVFLDYCVLNDALRDAVVLARLRALRPVHELLSSTTVVGEALAILGEGEREGQYMMVDLVRDLDLELVQPRKGWHEEMASFERSMTEQGVSVPYSELAHMALASLWAVDIYITSRAEARNLSQVDLGGRLQVVDLDQARKMTATRRGNH